MSETNLEWNGSSSETTADPATNRLDDLGEGLRVRGFQRKTEHGLSPTRNGKPAPAMNRLRYTAAVPSPKEGQPVLAVFCFESPDSVIGRQVGQTVAALARRQNSVYLFARHDFALEAPGVSMHSVGESSESDLVEQVQEFARRACNAFLQHFPAGCEHVTVMGYEWSGLQPISILRGIKSLNAIVSLNSLERQRSDLTDPVSQQIEAIELDGLRAARTILIQDPAVAEVVKYWAPECAERIALARPRFPVHHFESSLDPGAVKARYQVGPIDPTILCIGDLEEQYGPDLLVKALPPILKNHKQVRLIVVGDGGLYWPLRVYARYLLLEHAVRLPGSVEGQDLYELIQAADIVAVPSRTATPWWPIQAAWAAQKPVVATHTAAPGLLEHEQDSVLVYPSENSLVWGIERVLFDPEFGKTIARTGNEKLETRFGWNNLAEQVEELMGTAPNQKLQIAK